MGVRLITINSFICRTDPSICMLSAFYKANKIILILSTDLVLRDATRGYKDAGDICWSSLPCCHPGPCDFGDVEGS